MKRIIFGLVIGVSATAFSQKNSELGWPAAPAPADLGLGMPLYGDDRCIEDLREYFPDLKVNSDLSINSMVLTNSSREKKNSNKIDVYTVDGSVQIEGLSCKITGKDSNVFSILGDRLKDIDSPATEDIEQTIQRNLKRIDDINRDNSLDKAAKASRITSINHYLGFLRDSLTRSNDNDVEKHMQIDEDCGDSKDSRLRNLSDSMSAASEAPSSKIKDSKTSQ